MGDLWKKAGEAQREHNYAVREATKVFNKNKKETGKYDHVTFEAAIAPTREAYNKAYTAAKKSDIPSNNGQEAKP